MEWTRAFDSYCERTDLSYWSEPVNALTNIAFLLVAWVMYQRAANRNLPIAVALSAILAAIGVGSFLFHTHATVWAVTLDILPIIAFAVLFLFAANRYFWRLGLGAATALTLIFAPYSAVVTWGAAQLPFFQISSIYWPLPILIFAYAFGLRNRAPETARGLAIGGSILVVSLIFRSIDEGVCSSVPLGSHFLWHILNAVMLGWMIEVYRRHMLEGSVVER